MELEVQAIPGISTCFAALPLPLITALSSTSPTELPLPLALSLRAPSGAAWLLAWAGAASSSSAVQVDKKFAECIGLPDGARVSVKAVGSVERAAEVVIEPESEDDWEVLELNAELAEEAILKQVCIVHEGMKFPLWLHKHVIMVFLVSSTSPKKSVVQLVRGTEVAVAPKRREKRIDAYRDIQKQSSVVMQQGTKALLRVQAPTRRDVHKFVFKGVELGVVLTSVVFIHPETARKLSFDNLQLVTLLPRLPANKPLDNGKDESLRGGSSSSVTERDNESVTSSKDTARYTVVRILFSDTVVRGHIMLPQAVGHFLRASAHSWVYVKSSKIYPHKDIPLMTLSPCRINFKNKQKDASGLDNPGRRTKIKYKGLPSYAASSFDANVKDWSHHEVFLASFSNEITDGGEEGSSQCLSLEEKKFLIQSWVFGQLKAISSYTSHVEITSVVLANENLLHFEVVDQNLGNKRKESVLSNGFPDKGGNGKSVVELLYLLTATFEESSSGNVHNSYELTLKGEHINDDLADMELPVRNLELGEPVALDSVIDSSFSKNVNLPLSSLSWMETSASDVTNRLYVLLSPSSRKLFSTSDLPLPGHVLIYGPSGSGKSTLMRAVAKYLEEHEEILAHIVFISCSKLAFEKSGKIRQEITSYISEALVHSPSVIIFDDLDNIISSSSESETSLSSGSGTSLAKFFIDIMDEYGEKSQSYCGYGPIAFMATVQSLGKLPHSLTSSGRFDFHVQLPAPAVSDRGAILKHEILRRGLQCPEDILSEFASKCDGYDAYDLETLVDRAVHAAVSRSVYFSFKPGEEKPKLVKEDFSQAIHDFVPVAMRGLTKAASDGGRTGWEDVGGLIDICNTIQEMIELPSKFPSIFAKSPLRLRTNVLLYGPPGCGKTHIVGAAAAACSLRFISVKGPELLNKYIGASEQAVRDLFSKAATAAPCLLFFDEFDSIAPKRGHDNTGVTDRVVNQFLTELDGVEALTGVFVFAATSRPDLLDAALLRPGRLDRLLFCNFPSWKERLDILTVLSRKLPLASDVDLEKIASVTEGFSGADLQALLSDAQLASVHELLDSGTTYQQGTAPTISDVLLQSVASRARPSVSETEKRRLQRIYDQFLDAKKSVATQSKDAKGKRATLA